MDRLAKRHGSRSAAVRRLLEDASKALVYQDLEDVYRESLAVPGTKEKERDLTIEMLRAAAWPPEWKEGGPGGRKRGRRR
jgi:hypothetical protein